MGKSVWVVCLVFNLCQQDAHRLWELVTHILKPHTQYTQNSFTRKLYPEREGRKLMLYSSFSDSCALWNSIRENWYSLTRHYGWNDQKGETRSNLKKFTLTVWSKDLPWHIYDLWEANTGKTRAPLIRKIRRETDLTSVAHSLVCPCPSPWLNWYMLPSGNSVYYICT